jgi:hypothetical protein
VGYGEISQDGATLTNSADPKNLLTRVSGGPSGLVGTWRYVGGAMLAIEPDGTAKVASMVGRWKVVDQGRRTFMFVFPGPKPIVTPSQDGDSIKYVDLRQGVALDLQRLPC